MGVIPVLFVVRSVGSPSHWCIFILLLFWVAHNLDFATFDRLFSLFVKLLLTNCCIMTNMAELIRPFLMRTNGIHN